MAGCARCRAGAAFFALPCMCCTSLAPLPPRETQDDAAVAVTGAIEWAFRRTLLAALELMGDEGVKARMRGHRKPEMLTGGYILLAMLDNEQWCELMDREGEESLCDLVGNFADSATVALAQERAQADAADAPARSARQRIVGKVPEGTPQGTSAGHPPSAEEEASLAAGHDATAARWARHKDDAVTDVEASALLRCVHPAYSLSNDASLLLGALARELFNRAGQLLAGSVRSGSPPPLAEHVAVQGSTDGKAALDTLQEWLPAGWQGGGLAAARLAVKEARGANETPPQVTLRVRHLRGLVTAKTLRLRVDAGTPLGLTLHGPAAKALRVSKDTLVFVWRGVQLSEAATPHALRMGRQPKPPPPLPPPRLTPCWPSWRPNPSGCPPRPLSQARKLPPAPAAAPVLRARRPLQAKRRLVVTVGATPGQTATMTNQARARQHLHLPLPPCASCPLAQWRCGPWTARCGPTSGARRRGAAT